MDIKVDNKQDAKDAITKAIIPVIRYLSQPRLRARRRVRFVIMVLIVAQNYASFLLADVKRSVAT